jgi:hypothetical protein
MERFWLTNNYPLVWELFLGIMVTLVLRRKCRKASREFSMNITDKEQQLISLFISIFAHCFTFGLRMFRISSAPAERNWSCRPSEDTTSFYKILIHLFLAIKIFHWVWDFQRIFASLIPVERRDSLLGILSRLWDRQPRNRSSIPGSDDRFPLQNGYASTGTHQNLYPMCIEGPFSRGKAAGMWNWLLTSI